MPYGINILDVNGNSTISGLSTEFIVETIVPGGPGSKAFALGPGESLRAKRILTFSPGAGYITVSSVSVSGNVISWTTATDSYSTFPLIDSILVTKVVV